MAININDAVKTANTFFNGTSNTEQKIQENYGRYKGHLQFDKLVEALRKEALKTQESLKTNLATYSKSDLQTLANVKILIEGSRQPNEGQNSRHVLKSTTYVINPPLLKNFKNIQPISGFTSLRKSVPILSQYTSLGNDPELLMQGQGPYF